MSSELFKVLLIEDNPGDVYLFNEALRRAELNFELTVLADGAEAMNFVLHHGQDNDSPSPDVAILDLHLPLNGGMEILAAMRQSQHLADLPVVITSSFLSPTDRLRLERFGVTRYLIKPSHPAEFFEIGALLRQILVEGSPLPK
jgi:chemotaxis family two-component system response regulator Rcp1